MIAQNVHLFSLVATNPSDMPISTKQFSSVSAISATGGDEGDDDDDHGDDGGNDADDDAARDTARVGNSSSQGKE